MRDSAANTDDKPRGLVAEDQRRAHEERAIGAGGVVLHVGATETGGTDGDLEIMGSGRGKMVGFLWL